MRITDSMFFTSMQRNIAARQSDYAQAQARASSGERVEVPSDDPAAFAQARTQTAALSRAQGYQRNIDLVKPQLDTADSAMSSMDDVMTRIRDIAVQGSTDTLNASDKQSLSQELDSLRGQLVQLGNTQAGDQYVFGGYKNDKPPFDANGVYSGDSNAQQIEVGSNVKIPTGVPGDSLFGAAGSDIFTTITNLQTALASPVSSDVGAVMPDIDAHLETLRTAHSQIGVNQNSADIAEAVSTRAQDLATTTRSALVDIDAASSYTDLAKAQTALQAAIDIAGQLPPAGLVGQQR
jgi:flagellar hook-associated protein 3 FlgL